jgi:riboflavin synthase
MFTGIVETTARVREVSMEGSNKVFWLETSLASELKVDQSLAHNGVCLTVEEIRGDVYRVTAVEETLRKSSLGSWVTDTIVNLERSLTLSSRLDGHFVQGHVDDTATCKGITENDGSREIEFRFSKKFAALVVEKGSIAINGVSLTVFNVGKRSFTVAIIPYTFEHTNFRLLKKGDVVNLEFDLIGKYLQRAIDVKTLR